MYVCIRMCMFVCMCVYVYVYIMYMYIYIYILELLPDSCQSDTYRISDFLNRQYFLNLRFMLIIIVPDTSLYDNFENHGFRYFGLNPD